MKHQVTAVYPLRIPFKMEFSHSMATRSRCDSVVIELSDGEVSGFGEAVLRDYVTGALSGGRTVRSVAEALLASAASSLAPAAGPSAPAAGPWAPAAALRRWAEEADIPHGQLPVLCGVEIACWELLCRREGRDLYDVMGVTPARESVTYGGTVPILSADATARLIGAYRELGISNLRLKLGRDLESNRAAVRTARATLGGAFDLRVDANGAWEVDEAVENTAMLLDHGINTVEEPFGRDRRKLEALCERTAGSELRFVADESALTAEDLRTIASDGLFSMVNIRLSKNGGISRALRMGLTAEELGVEYQVGCHVGETGILSAAGRFVASVLPAPAYVDGSYDSYLLSKNITRRDVSFGPGGTAPIIRGVAVGYDVDRAKLVELSEGS